MSTISIAQQIELNTPISQGDIFKNIKYNYISGEDNEYVNIIEYQFPLAVIISQACDVIAMENLVKNKKGKPTKFMPSILMCPIYDNSLAKKGDHIKDIFDELSLNFEQENTYQTDDYKVAKKDWHYRIHALTVAINKENQRENIIEDAIIDFKHYFTVPITYLINNKENRIFHLDNLFAEQITLKFSMYLSRVAIP